MPRLQHWQTRSGVWYPIQSADAVLDLLLYLVCACAALSAHFEKLTTQVKSQPGQPQEVSRQRTYCVELAREVAVLGTRQRRCSRQSLQHSTDHQPCITAVTCAHVVWVQVELLLTLEEVAKGATKVRPESAVPCTTKAIVWTSCLQQCPALSSGLMRARERVASTLSDCAAQHVLPHALLQVVQHSKRVLSESGEGVMLQQVSLRVDVKPGQPEGTRYVFEG